MLLTEFENEHKVDLIKLSKFVVVFSQEWIAS